MIFEIDGLRLEDRKFGLCVGLVLVAGLLFHVADAGSFGGGILSYFDVSTSFSTISWTLFSLRFRLNFRLNTDVEFDDSCCVGVAFASGLGPTEKLGALGPLGLAWLLILFKSALYLGCI